MHLEPAPPPTGDRSPSHEHDSTAPTPLTWLHPLAVLAVLSALLGRALAPSVRGAALGGGLVIDAIDRLGAFLSQWLLLWQSAALLLLALTLLRQASLPLAFRLVSTTLAGAVLGLTVPASSARLSFEFSSALALASVVTALMGASRSVAVPRTRALGVALGLVALAGLTRQTAWLFAILGGDRASIRLALAGRALATLAVALHGATLLVALAWLATRRRLVVAIGTTLATLAAATASWSVMHLEQGDQSPWNLIVGHATQRLISPPAPFLSLGARAFLAAWALMLAVVAVSPRRLSTPISGAFALLLVCGTDVEVPLCSLALAVVAIALPMLSTELATDDASRHTPR